MEWVDVRAEIPWLGQPPFWLSHSDGHKLRLALARLGFVVFEARTEATATDEEFRRRLSHAMDLADYAWKNWDAFVDAFGDLVRSTTAPIAFIWLDPIRVFAHDLVGGLRLYSMLTSVFDDWDHIGPEHHQVVLFLQGEKHLT